MDNHIQEKINRYRELRISGARTQEELEIPVGAVKDFRTERVEVSYKRLKADWNKDKDVVGFWSQKVIRFNLLNHGESSKAVEIIEPPASGAELTGDENWKWRTGKLSGN